MTDFVVDRLRITKKVLSIINPDYSDDLLNFVNKSWWLNIRKNGGLGLSNSGWFAFKSANLEYWTLKTPIFTALSAKTRLKLDQYFPCPYFLERTKDGKKKLDMLDMHIFDSRIFVTIQLYGNLQDYLDKLETKVKDYK